MYTGGSAAGGWADPPSPRHILLECILVAGSFRVSLFIELGGGGADHLGNVLVVL